MDAEWRFIVSHDTFHSRLLRIWDFHGKDCELRPSFESHHCLQSLMLTLLCVCDSQKPQKQLCLCNTARNWILKAKSFLKQGSRKDLLNTAWEVNMQTVDKETCDLCPIFKVLRLAKVARTASEAWSTERVPRQASK